MGLLGAPSSVLLLSSPGPRWVGHVGQGAIGGLCTWLDPDLSDAGPEEGAAERSGCVG